MNRRATWSIAALVVWGLAQPLRGASLPENFTLGRYVPDTCWMLIHVADNPERAYIDEQWERVFEALRHSGIQDEIKGLIKDLLDEPDRPAFEEQWSRALQLGSAVSWSDLFGREFVYAQQMSPLPTYLFLTHGTAETGQKNLPALAALLEHLASLSDSLCVQQETIAGVRVWSIALPGAPISIELFGRGDVIGLSTSRLVTSKVASLMGGCCGEGSIIDQPRFQQAIAALPRAEDGIFFFNIKALIRDLGALGDVLLAQAPQDPDALVVKQVLAKILNRVDVFDYSLTVQETEGLRELAHSITALQAEKKDAPLARVFANRKPFENPQRFIPAEATSFSVSSTIDWGALYALALEVIAEDVPQGAAKLEQWKGIQASVGLDLQRDFFDWFGGEMVSFSLPAKSPNPFGSADGVLMLGVKDARLAAEKVNAGIDKLAGLLKEHAGQVLLIQEAPDISAPGFRVVTHPAIAMWLRPVVGVHGRWLIIGSSAEAVNAYLATSTGRAPCILENERFKTEGLVPTSPVSALSFSDMTNLGQELATGFSLMNMMMVGLIQHAEFEKPNAPETRPLRRMISILGRLTPALAEIDFYSSSATTCTFDGLTWRMERVLNYRPPPTLKK